MTALNHVINDQVIRAKFDDANKKEGPRNEKLKDDEPEDINDIIARVQMQNMWNRKFDEDASESLLLTTSKLFELELILF